MTFFRDYDLIMIIVDYKHGLVICTREYDRFGTMT